METNTMENNNKNQNYKMSESLELALERIEDNGTLADTENLLLELSDSSQAIQDLRTIFEYAKKKWEQEH